jgi:hypothetical protein
MKILGFAPDAFDSISSQEELDKVLSILLPLFESTDVTEEEKTAFLFPGINTEKIN